MSPKEINLKKADFIIDRGGGVNQKSLLYAIDPPRSSQTKIFCYMSLFSIFSEIFLLYVPFFIFFADLDQFFTD